jgi:hypothetical protein
LLLEEDARVLVRTSGPDSAAPALFVGLAVLPALVCLARPPSLERSDLLCLIYFTCAGIGVVAMAPALVPGLAAIEPHLLEVERSYRASRQRTDP